jgi:hypothetical protein
MASFGVILLDYGKLFMSKELLSIYRGFVILGPVIFNVLVLI